MDRAGAVPRPPRAAAAGPAARASPRIQDLVNRFEDQSRRASGSSQPSSSMVREGLPRHSSGPVIGPHATARAPRPSIESPSSPTSTLLNKEQAASAQRKGPRSPAEEPLIPSKSHRVPEAAPQGDERKAFPAALVFSRQAPPLSLPALDKHLSRREYAASPRFTDPRRHATQEERLLFGWSDSTSTKGASSKKWGSSPGVWEIAGGQICTRSESGEVVCTPKSDGELGEESFEMSKASTEMKRVTSASTLVGSAPSKSFLRDADEGDVSDERPGLPSLPSFDSSGRTESTGVPSQLSSASHPMTRTEMFPPLMLLKEQSLDELKSNAVGPRAPPGGFLANFPTFQSLLGTITDLIIGVEGSSFAAGILRLETLRDFAQLVQNNSSWINSDSSPTATGVGAGLRRFFSHTLPAILALDFVSLIGRAEIFLVGWMFLGAMMMWRFWSITRALDHNRFVDGFDSKPAAYTSPARGTKACYILLVFGLTTIYIPLTKLAVDTLVWHIDFWVFNPTQGSQDLPSSLPPLGDSDHYRDPLDFCYTTTMRKDKFNFAWLLLPVAVLSLIFFTIGLPIRMVQVLRRLRPHVSEYNEMGLKRTPEEMDIEYQRLLGKDKSPLIFMINGYRRRWAFYKPIYILCFKFTNVLVISSLTRNNCLWRFQHAKTMQLVQQGILIGLMSFLLGIHVYIKPFVDMISNRSEMVSRICYVLTALLGLVVALRGSSVYQSTLLYIVLGCSYLFNFYFALAGTSIFEHAVKRAQQRLDFSIDIFSPALDLQKHIRRRIWEETFSTILLSAPSYRMPMNQLVAFSTSDVDKWPPYLLNFQNTAAERHVENIKLLRELGTHTYQDWVNVGRGHVAHRWFAAIRTIQMHYAGPDAYWRPIRPPYPDGVSSFFGKAFAIPFPPTVVMRYDQGSSRSVQLTTLEEIEAFVAQNEQKAVRQARRLRLALRSLDGERVYCPHVAVQDIYANTGMFGTKPRRHNYSVAVPVTYIDGVLQIRHRDPSPVPGAYDFSSGFEVSILYEDGLREDAEGSARVRQPLVVSGSSAFELFDDFRPSAGLAKFLHDNQILVKSRIPLVEKLMEAYRARYYDEARRKRSIMSYSFTIDIFSNHRLRMVELEQAFDRASCCDAVRELPYRYRSCIISLYERLEAINRSEVHRWWWLFWDDLWRRNSTDIAAMRKHRKHLSPSFPTSIAYRPMPRPELENFLAKHGLWINGGKNGFIHTGTLNSIYFYLDELVFSHGGSQLRSKAIKLGIGTNDAELESHEYESLTLVEQSAGTGGGTDYERSEIIDRHAKRWEVLMSGRPTLSRWDRAWNRTLTWLNLHPLKVDGKRKSLFLYLRLRDGRYELPGEESLRIRTTILDSDSQVPGPQTARR
ncbi:hypothetical protein OC845_002888 [Tilletia horrida]|nr:hypothetical protein OC845_002888 [Tilletia horrida]